MTPGIGIVGAGMVGQMCHLANFAANPACRVVALADLRPELAAFPVIDPGVSGRIGRYEIALAWLYELPTGQRLSGGLATMPSMGVQDPAEAFAALLDHLGAPLESRDRWLMEHMILLADSFRAIQSARVHPLARYDPDLAPEPFRSSVAALDDTGEPVADQPQAALDGKTLREATIDPALRPQLVRLLKEHVRASDRLRRVGLDVDPDQLLGELGFGELILPPPPLGAPEEDEMQEEGIPLDPPPVIRAR